MLHAVTFTGIDNETNLNDIIELQNEFHFLEFGVLISSKLSNTGINNRYPDISILENYKDKGLNLSCHLCGGIAREVIQNNNWQPFYDLVGDYKDVFQRIQLNIGGIEEFSKEISFPREYNVIVQLKNTNTKMYDMYKNIDNVFGFQDNSGGTGIYQNKWMAGEGKFFGYAGGIDVDNVESTIQAILSVNKNYFWIDMESFIRTFEWLDINKCYEIAKICSKYIKWKI